jgi:hypothetical protein
MHADYGLGSYIGVDGAEFTPGNTWGHLQVDGTALTAGDHEFESLGFEDCCDGYAQLEVHLPCDQQDSSWRVVSHGDTDCLVCSDTTLVATCLGETYYASSDVLGCTDGVITYVMVQYDTADCSGDPQALEEGEEAEHQYSTPVWIVAPCVTSLATILYIMH